MNDYKKYLDSLPDITDEELIAYIRKYEQDTDELMRQRLEYLSSPSVPAPVVVPYQAHDDVVLHHDDPSPAGDDLDQSSVDL